MKATATSVKNHFGQYLESAISEPVVIEKTGRPVAVMISYKDYSKFTDLENAYWKKKAFKAKKTGFLSHKESMKSLLKE